MDEEIVYPTTPGKLIMVRGHAGSGKSTYAQTLMLHLTDMSDRLNVAVVEADQWRQPQKHMPYLYDPNTDKYAHAWTAMESLRWLQQGWTVIVANTFVKREYIDVLAKVTGWPDMIIHCDWDYMNTHGVPPEVVQRMKDDYEPIEGEIEAQLTPAKEAANLLSEEYL